MKESTPTQPELVKISLSLAKNVPRQLPSGVAAVELDDRALSLLCS
jgi:hypothetical protein